MAETQDNPNVTRPRVLLAIGELGPGGSENQLTEFVTRAHPRVVDAAVVTWRPPNRNMPNERRTARIGIRREWIGFPQLPRPIRVPLAAVQAWHLIRTLAPDVVYCWLEESSLFFVPAARVQGIPVIVARRNVSGARIERIPAASWAIRHSERLAQLVTGNSQAVIEAAVRRGIAAERLRLVPNGHPEMLPAAVAPGATRCGRLRSPCFARRRATSGFLMPSNSSTPTGLRASTWLEMVHCCPASSARPRHVA